VIDSREIQCARTLPIEHFDEASEGYKKRSAFVNQLFCRPWTHHIVSIWPIPAERLLKTEVSSCRRLLRVYATEFSFLWLVK
jgi:hypothetical protein